MIILKNLSLNLSSKVIFNDISLTIAHDQRIGLVGRNGSGKTTLLKTINGQQGLDYGQVIIEKRKKVAYLPQEVVLTSDKSVLDETLSVFDEVVSAKNELRAHEESLIAYKHDAEKSHELIERISALHEFLSEHNLDQLTTDTKKMLLGLGFTPPQLDQTVSKLSVGWKMRIVLAKLLLQKADFYLFDEPTNHLDIFAKDWFLEFLKQAPFGFMLVCHDRFFLDQLCTNIFELDRGNGKLYRGNYSTYMQLRETERAEQIVAYAEQQRMIKHKMEIINKFRAKASKASTAQSMLRALEKVERIEVVPPPPKIKLNFSHLKQPGKIVIRVSDISHKFENREIFKNVSFELFRGDKAAIVASNGVGKTTLINIITGKIPKQHGTIEIGHNATVAVFEQDQEAVLDRSKTIYEEVESICTTQEMRTHIRPLLGAFLFSGDDVDKKIAVLSGGEKNRVAMVKVLLQQSNVLILDEPTNHLDIESKDILLKALKLFPGTILFVSHDHEFLNGLADRILELSPNGIISYAGNFESYHYQKEQEALKLADGAETKTGRSPITPAKSTSHGMDNSLKAPKIQKADTPALSGKELYELRKKVSSAERKVTSLEKEQLELAQKLEHLEYGTPEFNTCYNKTKQAKKDYDQAIINWEELSSELKKHRA